MLTPAGLRDDSERQVIWVHGSKAEEYVREHFKNENLYEVLPDQKWFEGVAEDDVLWFKGTQDTLGLQSKKRRTAMVETKGGTRIVDPEKIIITTASGMHEVDYTVEINTDI